MELAITKSRGIQDFALAESTFRNALRGSEVTYPSSNFIGLFDVRGSIGFTAASPKDVVSQGY